MKNLKLCSLLFLLITTSVVSAQTHEKQEDKPYIEVTGNAEMEVVPDIIYIGIVIRERYEGREKITIEKQEDQLKEALKTIQVDISNLTLSDANADYVKVKWSTKDVLTKKEYQLKVSNATTVGKVFQLLDQLTIKEAYITKVDHSRIDSLKKEIRIKAIKSAKEKAEYLLSAINEQMGKPFIIYEQTERNGLDPRGVAIRGDRAEALYSLSSRGVDSREGGIPDLGEIQFNKIKIHSNIYIRFAIK